MKKKRKKIRFKGLIFLLLLFYLIGSFVYYLFTFPVKNVSVINNYLVSEGEVIQSLKLDKKTPMIKVNKAYVKKYLKDISLIDNFTVKRSLKGKITIDVKESKLLFLYSYDKKIVLSNGKKIDDNSKYLGIPTVINYIPSDVYDAFIKEFSLIDKDIISMISEIEYNPDKYNDSIIDSERFVFYMNDGNKVYINNVNMTKLNKYQDILDTVGTGGILYLDSASKNYIFKYEEEL